MIDYQSVLLINFKKELGEINDFCNWYENKIIPKTKYAKQDKSILNCRQKKKRLLNLSLNFIFPHSNTVHPSSYILTSDKCAFLGIKYVFRKQMLTSLGKNNVAPDPSGWKIFFFFFPPLRASFSICCLGSIKENSWLLRQKLCFFEILLTVLGSWWCYQF